MPLPISKHPPYSQPKSGSLILYDRTTTRQYKRDGYTWIRKHKTNKVREDHVKLRYDGAYRVSGTYVHCDTIPTMHRRSYHLIDDSGVSVRKKQESGEQSLVLVHYLDTAEAALNVTSGTSRPTINEVQAIPREEFRIRANSLEDENDQESQFDETLDRSFQDTSSAVVDQDALEHQDFRTYQIGTQGFVQSSGNFSSSDGSHFNYGNHQQQRSAYHSDGYSGHHPRGYYITEYTHPNQSYEYNDKYRHISSQRKYQEIPAHADHNFSTLRSMAGYSTISSTNELYWNMAQDEPRPAPASSSPNLGVKVVARRLIERLPEIIDITPCEATVGSDDPIVFSLTAPYVLRHEEQSKWTNFAAFVQNLNDSEKRNTRLCLVAVKELSPFSYKCNHVPSVLKSTCCVKVLLIKALVSSIKDDYSDLEKDALKLLNQCLLNSYGIVDESPQDDQHNSPRSPLLTFPSTNGLLDIMTQISRQDFQLLNNESAEQSRKRKL